MGVELEEMARQGRDGRRPQEVNNKRDDRTPPIDDETRWAMEYLAWQAEERRQFRQGFLRLCDWTEQHPYVANAVAFTLMAIISLYISTPEIRDAFGDVLDDVFYKVSYGTDYLRQKVIDLSS